MVWLLEMSGVLFMVLVYSIIHKILNFSKLTNLWFFIGICLITIGAHYSFPNVPLFENTTDLFGENRNNYDKIGHVVQGIVPVLMSWEVLVKYNVLRNTWWISLFSFCVAITVSALYELVEWLFIYVFGNNAYTFDVLGTQGYVWDAQSDMLCAFIGAILTILIGRPHLNKLLKKQHGSSN